MASNKIVLTAIGAVVVGLVLLSNAKTQFLNAPLFEDAVSYTAAVKLPNCEPRNGPDTVYHECLDSRALYDSALKAAADKSQPLMVIFGFDECPACQEMDTRLFSKSPQTKKDLTDFVSDTANTQIRANKSAPTISVLRVHIRNENGIALAKDIGALKIAKDRGAERLWSPFIIMVDPKTDTLHSEESWVGRDYHCYGYMSEIAASLEALNVLPTGQLPYTREMCQDDA